MAISPCYSSSSCSGGEPFRINDIGHLRGQMPFWSLNEHIPRTETNLKIGSKPGNHPVISSFLCALLELPGKVAD